MTALMALLTMFRTTVAIALVGLIAFGAVAGPLAAAQFGLDGSLSATLVSVDHQNTETETTEVETVVVAKCQSGHDQVQHDSGDVQCCTGVSTTIITGEMVLPVPAGKLGMIEPFYSELVARPASVEFIRPPSLTI